MNVDGSIALADFLRGVECSHRLRRLALENIEHFSVSLHDAKHSAVARNGLKSVDGVGRKVWDEISEILASITLIAMEAPAPRSMPEPPNVKDNGTFIRLMPNLASMECHESVDLFRQEIDPFGVREMSVLWRVYGVGVPRETQAAIAISMMRSHTLIGMLVLRAHRRLVMRRPEFEAFLAHHRMALMPIVENVDMRRPKNWSMLPSVARIAISGVGQSPWQWIMSDSCSRAENV